MLHIILDSIVPVFFVMALGYLAGWMRDIDNHHVAELNALVTALAVPPVIGREAMILCAVPSGFFGILFGLRYVVVSLDAGSTLIASSLQGAGTLPAAMLLTAGTQ
jgi:hypothetical protein